MITDYLEGKSSSPFHNLSDLCKGAMFKGSEELHSLIPECFQELLHTQCNCLKQNPI